ncbi:MAG: hypothetical protein BWY71_02279 [Planctomycetes bacterium ADurb.Bin412]|nr:MAG: hypothetical protein BWY71_02279 [Planctomycetes bacterium ADurb.Bin412]
MGPVGVLHVELAILLLLIAEPLDHIDIGGLADHHAVFLQIIQRKIGFLTEDPDLAFGFEGQAGSRQIRHAAAFKGQPDVGNILMLAEYIHADGLNIPNGAARQG